MTDARPQRSPSLRRRLLAILLVPILLLMTLDAAVTYVSALKYSNHVHDANLADDVRTLAQMFRAGKTTGDLTEEARFLVEYDPDGHNYFIVRSSRRGLISANGSFDQPAPPEPDAAPLLFDSQLGGNPVRAAAMSLRSPADPDDVLTVTIGETLENRQARAREILVLATSLQVGLLIALLALVWLGVSRGLHILHPLTRRLAAREHDLEPISGPDVPVEILPLTRTIDGLFGRIRTVLALQERFIADAAHQLRTPLAGLRLHVDRVLGSRDPATVRDALVHIERLTERAARNSHQLLALTRAQSPGQDQASAGDLDLADFVPKVVERRLSEAIKAGIDLGYSGPGEPAVVRGNPAALEELLDNLIDNVLRYAGRGAHATVAVLTLPDHGVLLQVEDSGPGVPAHLIGRLGERFFRVPGGDAEGTGLGLAIVAQIAQQHGAGLAFGTAAGGGLRVGVQFPPRRKVDETPIAHTRAG